MPKTATDPDNRFDPDDTASFTLNMPKALRKRVREIAKAMHLSNGAVVILALSRLVDEYDAKAIAEAERARREKEEKQQRRRFNNAPVPLDSARPAADEESADDELYDQHARRIAEAVGGDHREVRLRRDEALAAIRRQFPLTCPPEDVIVARLERLVRKLPAPKPKSLLESGTRDTDDDEIIIIKETP